LTWRDFVKRLLALALALPFVLAAAGPAAGYQTVSETGMVGEIYLTDTMEMPAGTCTYGEKVYSNWAYLRWMKVRAPQVFAADRNASRRDRKQVSWQWKLQRMRSDETTWRVIKSSAIQRGTAYEDQKAPFTAMQINYNSHNEDLNHNAVHYVDFRALVIIKWFKGDGSLEGTVKLVPSWYRTMSYWAAGPQADKCARINTDG
jgi:hypothetical protein